VFATQDEKLRRKNYFIGLPDMVMNYFQILIAQEVREIWPIMGVAKNSMILFGRTEVVKKP